MGARGNVAATAITGARAIARGEVDTAGMVSEVDPVASLDLPEIDDLVFGGHDIRTQSIEETAEEACRAGGVPDSATLDAVREDLREIDERVTIGTAKRCGAAVSDLSDGETLDDEPANPSVIKTVRGKGYMIASDTPPPRGGEA